MGKRKYETVDGIAKKTKTDDVNNTEETSTSSFQPQNNEPETKSDKKHFKKGKFDVKHLRKELTAKHGQTIALTQFLQVCLDPDSDADYMLEYLNAGGNSHEILRQVSSDSKKNLTLATPAFHLFHLIILKVQSSCPQMISITEEACRYFLNNFMSTVEIMISENSGPKHKKIILKLFTSMVTLNPDLGIDILHQAPLTPKHLQHILEKPNYKEKDNVRTAFVHFMTSFLVDGHLPLIKALLEKQGLLSLVIPGLIQDEAEAVLMFLNILKNNIIENTLISKSLKLKTFNHNVLNQLFRVFFWKGPPETSHEIINEFRIEITNLLSSIMLILFTSSKLGLYFTDTTLGTTDANKNQNLYKAVLSLKRPWENEKLSEILLEIIYKCPDLHRAVISLIEQNFEPQQSQIWEKTVKFVIELYVKFKPEELVPRFSKLKPLQVANFIRFATLPVPVLKHLTSSLTNSDNTISLYCVKVLVKMLASLKRYMHILEMDGAKEFSLELTNKLEYFFPKHLPSPSIIVTLLQQTIEDKPTTHTESLEYHLPKIDKTESLILLIDLLLLYHDIHPALFESLEGNLNMKEILDYSVTLSVGRIALLKFKIVSLWLSLDSTVVSLQNPMFKDLFQILLDVYTNSNDNTWMEAKNTVYNFFKSSNIYETDDNEIDIMLYALRNCKVDSACIGDVVEYVLENHETLSEYVKEQTVHLGMTEVRSEASIEKLLDDLADGKLMDNNSLKETKTPSSPFLIGCVKYMQINKDAKKKLKNFLSVYAANLLHFNFSSELTEVLIGDSKVDVRSYISNWSTEPVMFDNIGQDETLKGISKTIFNEESLNLEQVFNFIKVTTSEDYDFMVKEIAYKFAEIDIDSSELIIWAKYLVFCVVRLANLQLLNDTKQILITEILNVIIEICTKWHLSDVSSNVITSILKNSQFVELYCPIESKIEAHQRATEFVINIVSKHHKIIKKLNGKQNLYKGYQQKNYTEIVKALAKPKKKRNMNCEQLLQVLDVIDLTFNDTTRILKLFLDVDIVNCVRDDKEPSFVLEILKAIIAKYSSLARSLTDKQIKDILTLYTKLITNNEINVNLTNLETELVNYFVHKPQQVKVIPEEIFRSFFNATSIRKSTSQLAAALLNVNVKLCTVFKEELNRQEILSQRELTLPLGESMLKHKSFVNDNLDLMCRIYQEYQTNIFKVLEKPHKAGQVYIRCCVFVRKLLVECAAVDDCVKLFSKSHKFEVLEQSHIISLHAAFLKICIHPDKLKSDHVINYYMCILNLISMSLKELKDEQVLKELLNHVFIVNQVIININIIVDYKKLTESGVWQGFCKTVLKDSLKMKTEDDHPHNPRPALLFTFSKLIQTFYQNDHDDIVTIFDMATSHSEFLKVMLSYNSPEIKSRLLELIFILIQKNKSVMKQQQIPVYLSAYGATKTPCDKLILCILHYYESNGLPVQEYKPYLWGDSAANYYAVRKNRAASLWSQPTPSQIMNLFDKETLGRTLQQFDIGEKLDYQYEMPPIFADSKAKGLSVVSNLIQDGIFNASKLKDVDSSITTLINKSKYDVLTKNITELDIATVSHKELDMDVYDPAFILPLLSHILSPGSVASCFKLLRKGLLSVPLMALSSSCPMMRAAAYHVLHRFSMLLETESKHKNDKLLLTDFIETLRNSLKSAIINNEDDKFNNLKNPRLPSIDALYLAKAIIVSTAPFEPVYKPVNNFLIAKQHIDLTMVPDFLSLFHDCDVEFAERRNWILNIIRYGTKSIVDVNVVFKTMCIKMIMDFYSSVLCDRKGKERILCVIDSLVAVPRASDILIEGYGLKSWIHGAISQLKPEDRSLFKPLVLILKTLIQSMQVGAFSKILIAAKKTEKSILEFTELRVNKDLEHDVLNLLVNLLTFTVFIELDDFIFYLNTFNLLSSKTIKVMNKKEMVNVIKQSGSFRLDADIVNLLCKTVSTNTNEMLSAEIIRTEDSEMIDLQKELVTLVKTYIV